MKCFVCFICPTESGVWRAQDVLSSILTLQNYCEFWGASEALRDPVRLENGVDSAGICPGLSITIQIIHPSLLLRTEKLLQHNAFSRTRLVRSKKNGHAFEKSKNVTWIWPIPSAWESWGDNRRWIGSSCFWRHKKSPISTRNERLDYMIQSVPMYVSVPKMFQSQNSKISNSVKK